MNNFSKFLKQTTKSQQESIRAYHLGQLKVWLKKSSDRHSAWIYLPLRWLASLFNIKALTPIPNRGGSRAILCEAYRIQDLQGIGVSTPNILAISPSGLLLEDAAQMGEDVIQLDHALAMYQDDSERKFELFEDAVKAIQEVHQKDGYLSEAFARNILVSKDKQFTFIDFETDPGEVLDIETCQIRDWLCFIFSTAYRFTEEEIPRICQIFINTIFPYKKIYKGIKSIGKKLAWAKKIKFDKFGNDGKRIQKCLMFFQILEQEEPLPMI